MNKTNTSKHLNRNPRQKPKVREEFGMGVQILGPTTAYDFDLEVSGG